MTIESLIVWVIVGGVAGTIADWLVSGVRLGCLSTVVVGIIGAFIGAWVLRLLGVSIGSGLVNEIITASIGAIVLLIGIRMLRRV
jgi:uncharacterized membrane protein YeaQ/YmgE (transglycosylase-associated protein family)